MNYSIDIIGKNRLEMLSPRYRYHLLRCLYEYQFINLNEGKIEDYFNGGPTWGLYEEWIVLTEDEFNEYVVNPPNYDRLIKVLGKEKI